MEVNSLTMRNPRLAEPHLKPLGDTAFQAGIVKAHDITTSLFHKILRKTSWSELKWEAEIFLLCCFAFRRFPASKAKSLFFFLSQGLLPFFVPFFFFETNISVYLHTNGTLLSTGSSSLSKKEILPISELMHHTFIMTVGMSVYVCVKAPYNLTEPCYHISSLSVSGSISFS